MRALIYWPPKLVSQRLLVQVQPPRAKTKKGEESQWLI